MTIPTIARPVASERLLTPKEAAHYLRVSVSWLAKARMRGDGPPYIRVGRSVRYNEAALLQWMKSRQRLSTSEREPRLAQRAGPCPGCCSDPTT